MKALVIGASGIIGNHIVRELLNQGHTVFAGSRGVSGQQNLEGLDVTSVRLDIEDKSSLVQAFKGMDWVFHAAAYYPKNTFGLAKHVDVALQGVRNIIDASLEAGIGRLIYTSSLTTIGKSLSPDKLADETCPYDMAGHDPHPYFACKHLSELELKSAFESKKLPVVMVNPTGCFGPYELKPKSMCLIPMLVGGEMPAYVNRPINVVDTADVAKGQVLAAQKGRLGERYILGAQNTDTAKLIKNICKVAKVKPPKIKVPMALGLGVCYVDETISFLRKKNPKLSILGLRFSQYGQHLSCEKAVTELGYKPASMEPCFERALAWYKKIGYIS